MRVLVTGGAGFIGSNVVDHLIRSGCEVVVLDNLSSGNESFVHNKAELHIVDIASEKAFALVKEIKPDAIIHLAAQIDVRKSISDPVFDAHVNVLGTLNMLTAAQRARVSSFISISSGGAVYGDTQHIPTGEDTPATPLSPYGASKYCSETYLELASRTSAIRCVSLRLSNVYGPRQSLHGEAGVVAIFAKKLLKDQPLIVFGDGLQTRDFVFVQDVCTAIDASLRHPTAHGSFNIGTGLQTSVNEIVEYLHLATQSTSEVRYAPAVSGEVRHSALICAKAETVLAWRPKTNLHVGLEKTVQFFREADRKQDRHTHLVEVTETVYGRPEN